MEIDKTLFDPDGAFRPIMEGGMKVCVKSVPLCACVQDAEK